MKVGAGTGRGMRSIPVTIYEATGGMFDAPTPPGPEDCAGGNGDDGVPELYGGDFQHLHRWDQHRISAECTYATIA